MHARWRRLIGHDSICSLASHLGDGRYVCGFEELRPREVVLKPSAEKAAINDMCLMKERFPSMRAAARRCMDLEEQGEAKWTMNPCTNCGGWHIRRLREREEEKR